MRTELKNAIKPIYKQLLANVKSKKDIYTFCVQWGKKFEDKENERILFVGKATNGWVTNSTNIETLFGDTENRIFERSDQMEWVNHMKGNKNGYNTNNSAFWRVIKRTTQNILNTEKPLSLIAWSNVYKVSYIKGNPTEKLKRMQLEYCKLILQREIQIMKPKFVVFLTSGWEKVFLKYLNEGIDPSPIKTIKWNEKYLSSSFKIDDTIYIASYHPQGKKEDKHINVLTELMKQN
jgi:hypothetical protein